MVPDPRMHRAPPPDPAARQRSLPRRLLSPLAPFLPLRNLRYALTLLAWARETLRTLRRRRRRARREERLPVAVDIAPYWEPLTGVGWYLDRLLHHLADREDLALRLYGPDLLVPASFDPEPEGPIQPLPEGPALERVAHRLPQTPRVALSALARRLCRPLAPLLLAADGNRVVFAPNFFPPRRFEGALLRGAALVATVHDLGWLRMPEVLHRETLEDLQTSMDRVWGRAAAVITVSRAVRQELVATGRYPAERIRAIHHGGVAAVAAPAGAGSAGAADTLPAGVPERFALFVGTLEPRKNVGLLLEAWERLAAEHPDPPALVLCGRLGWGSEELVPALDRGREAGWLHPLGYVEAGELAALYRGALLLAFPTRYEGFGLPVLEAAAAGIPLVVSDLPVLREVAGDAARYAPPDDPDAWARTLAEVLDDPEERQRLTEAGRRRVLDFDWDRTAAETAAVFSAVAGS